MRTVLLAGVAPLLVGTAAALPRATVRATLALQLLGAVTDRELSEPKDQVGPGCHPLGR